MTGMNRPTKLDLWVAGTMLSPAEVAKRLASVGVTREDAKTVAESVKGTRLASPLTADRTAVLDVFGAPLEEKAGRLVYDLVLWPDHQYEWMVATGGRVASNGFARRAPDTIPAPDRMTVSAVAKLFQPWVHTRHDVLRTLGAPSRTDGWWPEVTLFYAGASGTEEVAFTFDHDLLSSIAKEST